MPTVPSDGEVTFTASFPPDPSDNARIHVVEMVYVPGLPKQYAVQVPSGTLYFVPEPPPSIRPSVHSHSGRGSNAGLTVSGRMPPLPRPWWRRLLRLPPVVPHERLADPLRRVLEAFEIHQTKTLSSTSDAKGRVGDLLEHLQFGWDPAVEETEHDHGDA